ncbi:MAG: CPBP family glutamic-type intramembrane protease, partial [Terriglobales bacterium]
TWEDTKQSYSTAKLRVHVYISGNLATAYNHFLYVPETWTRKFARLRSYNEALAEAASIFYFAISGGAFFVFLWAFASGWIRWRLTIVVAVLYGVIACLDSLNSLPSALHDYNTSLKFSGFQLEFVVSTLTAGINSFLQTLVLFGAAESIYRQLKPHDIAIEHTFHKVGLRCRETLQNITVGLGTFGMHLGWIVAYYLAGRSFGFWSPMEVDNAETLSSAFPFFSAMETGWSAGLSEELMYRVLGLAGFQKIFRRFWIANILQAAAWAFMHSNYPQEPPYARGIELTVVGIIYGLVLRHFGLLACFFSHNLIDTYLGVAPLLSSTVLSLKLSALISLAP